MPEHPVGGHRGVLVETAEGNLHLAAATSDGMLRLEQAETAQRDGPCFQAYQSIEPVVSHDLREDWHRWRV